MSKLFATVIRRLHGAYAYMLYYSMLATLITFRNSLDPDQDRQNALSDLDPNRLTL